MSTPDPERVSTVFSRAPLGLAAPEVRVEVHLGSGLPAFAMVGLPEAVVRESKERVRCALMNCGFKFPNRRITVNLSPADLPKEGGRFDLPIALGILAASKIEIKHALIHREFYGELSLSGELRHIPKLLPALIEGTRCGKELIVPFANALEASLVAHANLKLANNLLHVCDALHGIAALPSAEPHEKAEHAEKHPPDLAEVRGQFAGKRGLEIAAAGEHGMLMIGPPGGQAKHCSHSACRACCRR